MRELLKLNPDYLIWEKQIPAGISTDEHDRMILMMASVWADDIKGAARSCEFSLSVLTLANANDKFAPTRNSLPRGATF